MKPGPGLTVIALLWLLAGGAGFFSQTAFLIWFYSGITLLPPLIIDLAVLLLLPARFTAVRTVSPAMAIGRKERITVALSRSDRGYLPSRLRLFDIYPDGFSCDAFPLTVKRAQWQKRATIRIEYTVLPVLRQPWTMKRMDILINSPLNCWQKKISVAAENSGRIFPDFKSMLKLSAVSLRGIYQSIGLKNRRRRGQGMEFMNLRDYREGDSIRAIDWRATSRVGKPIVKEYTEDQDKQVLLVLDSGYRLYRRDGRYLQFDFALNAVMMLSYAALLHGDNVAVSTFGNDERWIPPRKGKSSISYLLNGLYDINCSPVPSSPFAALEKAMERLKKRTFIILVSNLREEDGESLSWILPRLQKKHLLLTVSLTESEVLDIANSKPQTKDGILEKSAAVCYLNQRKKLFGKWEHSGLLTLESTPEKLSASLINTYLDLKKSGRL